MGRLEARAVIKELAGESASLLNLYPTGCHVPHLLLVGAKRQPGHPFYGPSLSSGPQCIPAVGETVTKVGVAAPE